jgi:hypothetical protein
MSETSTVFTYGAPFVGVLLVSIGIAAAVPGAYGILQNPDDCGNPTISVEGPDRTQSQFDGEPPSTVTRLDYETLSPAEQTAFEDALAAPVGEAELRGDAPHYRSFVNGTLVTYEGERHYLTVVAENACYEGARLQFPLGVFAIALGIVGILTPPGYRKLIELEEGLTEE